MAQRGPKPLFEEPMTGAERERRRRNKLKAQRLAKGAKEIRIPISEQALAVLQAKADEKGIRYQDLAGKLLEGVIYATNGS